MPRHKNFSVKLVLARRLSPDVAGLVALVGDSAGTAGAKLVRDYLLARNLYRIKATRARKKEIDRLQALICAAVHLEDHECLREMADFIKATRPPKPESQPEKCLSQKRAFGATCFYVGFCQSRQSFPRDVLLELKQTPTLAAAWARPPFTPSVREIIDHLAVVLGKDELPDYSTVESWAEAIGAKAAPRPR